MSNEKPLCKFGCGTIVSEALPSCEMCCAEAVADREARVAPIHAAEMARNAARTEKLLDLLKRRGAVR